MTTTHTSTLSTSHHDASAETEPTTMKVLIADKFEQSGVDGLEHLGCEVLLNPDLSPQTLPDAVAEFDPDVLIVRSTKVPAAVFEKAKSLSLVLRAGAGYDNIDMQAASARG